MMDFDICTRKCVYKRVYKGVYKRFYKMRIGCLQTCLQTCLQICLHIFKLFIIEPFNRLCPLQRLHLLQLHFLPLKVVTVSRPSTIKIELPEILTLPTTANDVSNLICGIVCPDVFGPNVSTSMVFNKSGSVIYPTLLLKISIL